MDKKSQHVGNHGGTYTDIDGMSKQFTYIDHDKKTTIFSGISKKVDNTLFAQYKNEVVNKILKIGASLCPKEYQDFTNRGEGITVITWNKKMLTDSGLDISRLRDLIVLLENKAESLGLPV